MLNSLRLGLIAFSLWMCISCNANGQLIGVESHYARLEELSGSNPQTISFIQEEMNLVEDFSLLTQIILLRHGEPALDKRGWRTRKEAKQFMSDYDSVGIYPPSFIPVMLEPGELEVIHTSSIPRSINTAQLVFEQEEIQLPDSLFREFERKIYSAPNIKLPLSWWLNNSRILWILGMNKRGIESFGEAKDRARRAVKKLEKDALANGKTLLVSHGLLNHFLVKYLEKNGWTEVYDGGKGYLSQKMLVRYGP